MKYGLYSNELLKSNDITRRNYGNGSKVVNNKKLKDVKNDVKQ